MPKKKKTLRQKMLADTRREQEVQTLYSFQSPVVTDALVKPLRDVTPHHAISTVQYNYLAADLRKTIFFTILVVLAEIVLYYFL